MTCGKEDPPGYTCGGGYPKGTHGCGQHFGSLDGFDAHFIKTGRYEDDESPIMRCATPKEMERKGYHLSDNLVWKTPIDEAAIARFRGHPSVTQGDLLAALGMTERG
jgi:hypothetical protein